MKIMFIGAGNMGGALIRGFMTSGISAEDIYVCENNPERCNKFAQAGANISDISIANEMDYVFLAVKPNAFESLLESLKGAMNPVYVSIAAGISANYIESIVGDNTKVVRTMPNTAAQILQGVTFVAHNNNVSLREFDVVKKLLQSVGYVQEIDESLMAAATALGGSSPAYMYMFIDSMASFAQAYGFDRRDAEVIAAHVMRGAGEMVLMSNDSPQMLRDNVCSKGGTTEKAIQSFSENSFSNIIESAMQVCLDRANEMER